MFDRSKNSEQDKPESPSSEPVAGVGQAPSRSPRPEGSGARATIGATVRIKGDVSGDENLTIEGHVEGTVSLASHELVIGPSGKVNADLTAKVIRIDGQVEGDITGKEKVTISSTSNIKGNIVTPKMTLEEGARFKGSIDIDPEGNASGRPSGEPAKASQPSSGSSQPSPSGKPEDSATGKSEQASSHKNP